MDEPYDELLMLFVGLVNQTNMHVSITLSASGTVFAGELISVRRYKDRLAELFARGGRNAQAFSQAFANVEIPTMDDLADLPHSPTPYLCLDETRILAGGQFIEFGDHGLWRIGIERVDGFALGS